MICAEKLSSFPRRKKKISQTSDAFALNLPTAVTAQKRRVDSLFSLFSFTVISSENHIEPAKATPGANR
jgi:hypothetical protein